ncbi:PIN domain-containing protein [Methanocalculus taiwanensis]|uniref:PIN domain-containing protein n=1 Tax=Methanocalculus taiwanensis TaxID=106207 RepID=A0ABD4TLS7_9EURY|nr:PIN domain-containing protein [Methanocalculus taiwanensis]MCQ1538728.1 PIN domain-containing protein [Methanocalculus taiwanensis]
MHTDDIAEGSVFLDTNILLYAFSTTRFSDSSERLLERIQAEEIIGYINSTVIDEFFHKAMLTQMYTEKQLSPRDAIIYIKQNPGILKDMHAPYSITHDIIQEYNLIILDTSDILSDTLAISQNYGLLFSDALHAASVQKHQIDYFATNDRDFDRVDFLTLAHP